MRIKNSADFFNKLHELEDNDPKWFDHIGSEDAVNHYVDDGSLELSPVKIARERELLKLVREHVGLVNRQWLDQSQRDGVRLWVTMYRNYGLQYRQISEVMGISQSTLKTNFKAIEPFEILDSDYVLYRRDNQGRIISQKPHHIG